MINGRAPFDCSKLKALNDTTSCRSDVGVTNFRFSPGKKHRLRLINAGGDGQQKFSIDGHTMTIIAQDYVPIRPYDTKGTRRSLSPLSLHTLKADSNIVVTIGIGQRVDVLVTGIQSKGVYTMRAVLADCSDAEVSQATALVYYSHAALEAGSTSTAWPELAASLANCGNVRFSPCSSFLEIGKY